MNFFILFIFLLFCCFFSAFHSTSTTWKWFLNWPQLNRNLNKFFWAWKVFLLLFHFFFLSFLLFVLLVIDVYTVYDVCMCVCVFVLNFSLELNNHKMEIFRWIEATEWMVKCLATFFFFFFLLFFAMLWYSLNESAGEACVNWDGRFIHRSRKVFNMKNSIKLQIKEYFHFLSSEFHVFFSITG